MSASPDDLQLIGWKEKVTFPAWGFTLKALIDPTTQISTLAVERVEDLGPMRDPSGRRRNVLRLVVPMARGRSRMRVVHAFYHRRTDLGEELGRCHVVMVPLRLGKLEWEAELALVPSKRRQYFLHLGRSDLRLRFLIDSDKSYLHLTKKGRFVPEPLLPLPETEERS
jgi:hypothetical protein